MNVGQLIDKMFFFLADPQGKMWREIEIQQLLENAAKQYSIDSCAYIGKFDLMPDAEGNYIYPEDFAGFLIGWNKSGKEIRPATSVELFEKQHTVSIKKGDPVYLYDNIVSAGEYRLVPIPPANQNMTVASISPFWGEIYSNEFGVFADLGYGVSLTITEYDFAGEIFYYRYAKLEEIQDYMAVIYYALYLAYSNDSDFANSKQAGIYWQRYRSRVAAFDRVKASDIGIAEQNKYF